MKFNPRFFLIILLSLGFICPEISEAKISKGEFKRNVREVTENKRGNGAIRSIVKELTEGVRENPTSAVAFTRLSNNVLKRLIRPNQRSKAAASLVQALGVSYFRGPKGYDANDPVFQTILSALVTSLPAELKTEQGLAPIYSGLDRLNRIRKGSPEDLDTLIGVVNTAAGIVPPPAP